MPLAESPRLRAKETRRRLKPVGGTADMQGLTVETQLHISMPLKVSRVAPLALAEGNQFPAGSTFSVAHQEGSQA